MSTMLDNRGTREIAVDRRGELASVMVSAGVSLLLIIGFSLLTALGAQFRIPLPFTPVPVTLQTLMVLLAGAALGSTRGALSQLLYVAWGVAGIPLFAFGAVGFAVLAGPTGGYILGFVVAATFVGRLIGNAHTVWSQATVFSLGTLIILVAGGLQLALVYTGGDFGRAAMLGIVPFLPGAVFKVIAATTIWRAWSALRRSR